MSINVTQTERNLYYWPQTKAKNWTPDQASNSPLTLASGREHRRAANTNDVLPRAPLLVSGREHRRAANTNDVLPRAPLLVSGREHRRAANTNDVLPRAPLLVSGREHRRE
jgi:hypothetical protein